MKTEEVEEYKLGNAGGKIRKRKQQLGPLQWLITNKPRYNLGTYVDKKGKQFTYQQIIPTSKYIPGGPNKNTKGVKQYNPKILANIDLMFNKWFNKKFGASNEQS